MKGNCAMRIRIGNKISQARQQLGLTQKDLCNIVGCSRANIAKIEGGSYLPSIFLLDKILRVLNMRHEKRLLGEILYL